MWIGETVTIAVQVVLFGLTTWLGLYLLVRNHSAARVRWTGYGLLAYAIGIGLLSLRPADVMESRVWERIARLVAVLPAVLWGGALLTFLLPTESRPARWWTNFWRYGVVPLTLLAAMLAHWTPRGVLLIVTIVPLLALVGTVVWSLRRDDTGNQNSERLALAVTIFLAMATVMVLATEQLIGMSGLWYAAMGADLLILGYLIATLDAWEQRERLGPDMVRSLDGALLKSLLLGSPVVAVMIWGAGQSPSLLLLLYVIVGLAVALHELDGPINELLDQAAFAAMPELRMARRDLRETATALPRVDLDMDLSEMAPDEFVRQIRRALSHLGNLPRLAKSPLTNLHVVRRTVSPQSDEYTLARATALKQILTESIVQLKPAADAEFGATDEWRHYNALYFPYVVGLKPFSRRADHGEIDDSTREALEWFQSQVPERTLYNWQNSAAELVAQHVAELDVAARNGD